MERMNSVLKEDLHINAVNPEIPYDTLKGSTIFVTGATGLVGSNLIRTVLMANQECGYGIRIIGLVRNHEKAERLFGSLLFDPNFVIVENDLLDITSEKLKEYGSVDYVFHTAAVTTSKFLVEKPVEAIDSALFGTRNILQIAREMNCRGVVYLSSMEMYGTTNQTLTEEKDIGYIDIMKVRSNYPESKRMCENMCVAYHSEYGLPVKIARLSQTFGAGILPGENRVFAQFARSAIRKEDIILHTAGRSEGNYCYLREAIAALLILLVKGNSGEAYNIVNEASHTTIAGMAEMVCREFGEGKCHVVFDIPETNTFGYAADVKMKLSGKKMMALGWTPEINLVDSYRRLIQSLLEENDY